MIYYTREEVSRAILYYLLRHPQAQDTLEGIVHWWLLEERIHQRTLEISDVVKGLVEKNFLIETRISDAAILYSLNSRKKNQIELIIKDHKLFQDG